LGPPVTVRRLDFPFPLIAMKQMLPRGCGHSVRSVPPGTSP
jgi:hypothetical protein